MIWADVYTRIDTAFKTDAAKTGEGIVITKWPNTIDFLKDYLDNEEMSKTVTQLTLNIDLTHYAEDTRVSIAKQFIMRALNDGILSPDDIASFCNKEECLMEFKAEECIVEKPKVY
jgi:hypothetical protein